MPHSSSELILVGRRNGALRAARKLGIEATVFEPGEFKEGSDGHDSVSAVVAVTEGAVLTAATIREVLRLPGVTLDCAHRCTDKLVMKQAIRAAGILCADFVPVPPGPVDGKGLADRLGLPLILKHRDGFGGRGTVLALRPGDLPATVERPCLAESFIDGIEMSVESFVVSGKPVFVNFTEYVKPAWSSFVPAPIARQMTKSLLDINTRSITALEIERGMTHMEVFLRGGQCLFGELAVRPPGGQIMRLIAEAYGFDPWEALLLIESGQSNQIVLPRQVLQSAAMHFIHPGKGVVRAVHGLNAVHALPTLKELQCKLKPGDEVSARDGTGQHRGFVIFSGDKQQVRSDLTNFSKLLRIEMN